MSKQRNTKIEQYRIKKELDDQIKKIKIVMEREHIDDDLKREFYIKLIKSSIMNSVDEISSIEQEKQILDHMSQMKHDDPDSERPKPVRRPTQPLRPIIITKDAVQKAVYGLGYPSMPTMTVDEFYTQRVEEGIFPDPSVVRDPNSLQSRAMRGEATELDEQEEVKKVRRQWNLCSPLQNIPSAIQSIGAEVCIFLLTIVKSFRISSLTGTRH